jgi:hypothetical protein
MKKDIHLITGKQVQFKWTIAAQGTFNRLK